MQLSYLQTSLAWFTFNFGHYVRRLINLEYQFAHFNEPNFSQSSFPTFRESIITSASNDQIVTDDLMNEFKQLWAEADEIWDRNQNHPGFHAYVSADYVEVVAALAGLRKEAFTFVEWGSGLGVVTIMASRMGFDAYGIEAEGALVEHSEILAEKWGPDSQFTLGSFIPDDFKWDPGQGDEAVRTIIDVPAAYEEMEMEIRDFDLIYSYPWPTEHELYHNVMREYAHGGSMLLTYDAREGIGVVKRSEL